MSDHLISPSIGASPEPRSQPRNHLSSQPQSTPANYWNGDHSTSETRTDRTGSIVAEDQSSEFSLFKKVLELEAKVNQMRLHPPDESRQQDYRYLDNHASTESSSERPRRKREPCIPELHKIEWGPFKHLILTEPIFAIDVLMGPPKFYWQRRADERDMKDLLEIPANPNPTTATKDPEAVKTPLGGPEESRITQKETPDRIRINSAPLLAILSEIEGETWSNVPKVFLRPYRILAVHEAEIRRRLTVLKRIWANRPKPDDITTLAEDVEIYETDSVADPYEYGSSYSDPFSRMNTRNSISSDALADLVNSRSASTRIDLTTTYEALQDLEVLVQFLDGYLSPIVRLHGPGSEYPKVYFRDLWHLFKAGDEVLLDERNAKRFTTDAGPESGKPSGQYLKRGEAEFSIWRVRRVANGLPKLSPPNKLEMNRPPSNAVTPFSLRCYRIDYDGSQFGPIWVDFHFQTWEGEKAIEQLEVIPLRMTKGANEKRRHFIERGKRFMNFTTPQHRHYRGSILTHHPSGMLFEHISPGQRDVYGPVIVDFKECARMNPHMVMTLGFSAAADELWEEHLDNSEAYPMWVWKDRKARKFVENFEDIFDDSHLDEYMMHRVIAKDAFLTAWENLMQGEFIDGSQFSDSDFMLLPNRVCAFILQRRRFALIAQSNLKLLESDSSNWDDLHLTMDNKETVKALTMSHFRNKKVRGELESVGQFDLNREKGLGLIILLHGVPGVGKSSTAECVAELLGKPLFPITCGDLGTTAEQVETQLYSIFTKAEKWDCVLLLDEADVFLASRGKNDLKRNAIVSVFLRILEFYTGILFLTTNRTGVLDEAFMSRIHTQLYYPPLNEEQTLKIWETNLHKLSLRKGSSMSIAKDDILDFARWHFTTHAGRSTTWNGRQIRNACMAAAALSEHETLGTLIQDGLKTPSPTDGSPLLRLEVRHFEKVDSAVRDFHSYMADVCGDDFSGVARMRGERADEYRPLQQDQYLPFPSQPQRAEMYPIRDRRDSYQSPHQIGLSISPSSGGQYPGYAPAPHPQYPGQSQRFAPRSYSTSVPSSEGQFGRSPY